MTMTACSSGSSSSDGDGSDPVPSTASSADGADDADDARIAASAVLSLDDFPDGWTSKPRSDAASSDDVGTEAARCLGTRGGRVAGGSTDADSPEFSSVRREQVLNSVSIARRATDVEKALDVLERADTSKCLADATDTAVRAAARDDPLPEGTTVGKAVVSRITLAGMDDRYVAFRVSVPISASVLSFGLHVDLVVAQRGRAAVFLAAMSQTQPFPTDMTADLLRRVVSRLDAVA